MISTIGFAMNEEDKHALGFVDKPTPHPILLKTRLLYDGGYTKEALEAIEEVDPKKLTTIKLKAEFCYRRGRIAQKQGEIARALKLYEACSLFALESDEYYGAYASIYIADYHLREGDKVLARKFYERALGFEKNKEYVESIEQRAKAGLKQC
jgi:tetratricopeptide (TPR) repeat protein